jgi:hypothetical protein
MCDEGAAEPEPEFDGCFGGAECLQLQREVVSWGFSPTEGDGRKEVPNMCWIGFRDATPLRCVSVYIGSLPSSAREEG